MNWTVYLSLIFLVMQNMDIDFEEGVYCPLCHCILLRDDLGQRPTTSLEHLIASHSLVAVMARNYVPF